MVKAAFNKKKNLSTSKLDLNLRKKLVKYYIGSIALYSAETWTLRKLDQEYLGRFEMWCWRRMEKSSWTDRVRNEVPVLHRVKEENIMRRVNRRNAKWIGQILHRNCFLKHVIEGKVGGRIEVTGRRERRHKQLMDGLKDKTGYWKLEKEALCRTPWRTRFGRGCGPVVRQATKLMNSYSCSSNTMSIRDIS
jgi:hypothetical protein